MRHQAAISGLGGDRRSRKRFIAALLVLVAALAAGAVSTANRMQGDRLGLWLREFSNASLELVPHSIVHDLLGYRYFISEVRKDSDGLTVVIPGFPPVPLDERLTALLRDVKLHDSLALGLYSMRFGRPLLDALEQGRAESLSDLALATDIVLDAAERFEIPPRLMAFNDHAVAERTEFLLLFLSKLEELDAMTQLQERLRRHIIHNAELLADDTRFTWETNHGLMQIRALLHLAEAAPRSAVGRSSLRVAVRRINETLPYLIADDGAVLEAASGYWLFVHKEWSYIAARKILPPSVRAMLQARLVASSRFIEDVVNCDGYLQGLGDSYSRRLTGDDLSFAGNASRVFAYSNGVAGFEYAAGKSCVQMLFASLDTPPPIHKMPEDLAVYVYAGEPFFANPGTYAYDESPERHYVLAHESQSTVGWKTGNSFLSSRLELPVFAGHQWIFRGEKKGISGRITREVRFVPATGRLVIVDQSDRELSSRFNVHPDVSVQTRSAQELVLKGRVNILHLKHNGAAVWKERWIATSNFEKTAIRQLEISGNPLEIELALPLAATLRPPDKGASTSYTKREQLAQSLTQSYRLSSLARTESTARYVKVYVLGFIAIALITLLLWSGVVPLFSWFLLSVATLYLLVDAAFEGFVTTAVLYMLQPVRTFTQ